MRRKIRYGIVRVGFILVLLVCVGLVMKGIIDNALYNRFYDRGLPRINIDLKETKLSEIKEGSKEKKYKNTHLSLYNNGKIDKFENVEIKGRGNSTWEYSKKPYQISFNHKVDLLKLGKAKKWVLLASRADHTFLRNDIAFRLAEMLELKYNHRGEFVELYFDGEYEGLYYLIQKIDIAKNSVDLRTNGGLLFELDNVYADEDDEEYYVSVSGNTLVLKDIKQDNEETRDWIVEVFLNNVNELETLAKMGNYDEVSKIIDIESFAKYYLVNEFAVNPDAYSTSFYLYKDGIEDKIHAGPVWDFDLALANHNWGWEIDEQFYSPSEEMIRRREAFGEDGLTENRYISKLMYYLMEMPEFRKEVKRIFKDKMSGRVGELVIAIKNRYNKNYKAMLINNEKWGIEDSEEEYEYLLDWIIKRFEFFESKYGDGKVNDQRRFRFL